MNKGEITLLVAGEDRKFDFTRMGVYSYLKEATGGTDPFEFLKRFAVKDENKTLLSLLIDDAATIIYAGINTSLDVEGKENIPLTTCKKWANSLKPAELAKVFEAFVFGLMTDETKPVNGEVRGETLAPVPGA